MTSQYKVRAGERLRAAGRAVVQVAIVLWAVLAVRVYLDRNQPLRQFAAGPWHQAGKDRFSQAARVYLPLRDRLRGVQSVGFVCGGGSEDARTMRHYMAQSMLAPTLVVRWEEQRVVIAAFDNDGQLAQFMLAGPFRLREHFGSGLAILDREAK